LLDLDKSKTIAFLHGWGDSKELMIQAFGKKFPDFKHIYIDLIGFGESSKPLKGLDTFEYSKIIQHFLNEIQISNNIIIGHSFGGKIATLLNPKILILLASAGIVPKKPFLVKSKIFLYKLFKRLPFFKIKNFFVSKDAKGLSQVMYETFKNVVDEDFTKIFQNRQGETYILWGQDDRATPLESGKIIHKLISKSVLIIFKGDHFFFLNNSDEVAKSISNILKINKNNF
jgi:pimeloyl-ACP methyl ester carboxylesterase